MLFVLVMECFSAMIKMAENRGLLQPLRPATIKERASLYADDVVVFLSPVAQDLILIREILSLFQGASSLASNYTKSKVFPIHCSEEHTRLIIDTLNCHVSEFPCTYLIRVASLHP